MSDPFSSQSNLRQSLTAIFAEYLKEKRQARRWRIAFRISWMLIILSFLSMYVLQKNLDSTSPHTALVNLEGVVDAENISGNARDIGASLREAFGNPNSKGVILRVDSPGGSPVQASLIHQTMLDLQQQYPDKPLYVVVEDLCASACYFLATAAKDIIINPASIVGSIGVRASRFNFVGAMQKLGITHHLYTSGKNKALGDPFEPNTKEAAEHIKVIGDTIHNYFVDTVKARRKERLKGGKPVKRDDVTLFTGSVWVGQKSIDLGIADAFGSVESVAREKIKAAEIIEYAQEDHLISSIMQRFSAQIKASAQSFFQMLALF